MSDMGDVEVSLMLMGNDAFDDLNAAFGVSISSLSLLDILARFPSMDDGQQQQQQQQRRSQQAGGDSGGGLPAATPLMHCMK